jgi:threonine aldolase
MVYFRTPDALSDEALFARTCSERGVLLLASGKRRIRMVTHLGIDESSVRRAVDIIKEASAL